ncbi:MAG: ABC transporter substrate-binding protein [Clostridiales bacterium]|jgi:ABC-type branched-subunit amino acid transport system substrate-binding protein|nr:ABC transporter substrate-binding protein [Clostridiales bacterium]
MKKTGKILALAMVAILAVGVFAGCRRETGTVQGVTDDAIYIGNTAAVSGALAGVGVPFVEGMRSYLAIVNAAGGVHGREIRFVHHDDTFDAPTGLAFTESLIHDDQVFAIVGHFGTPTIGATLPMLKETGIPVVYFAAGISELFMDNANTPETGQRLFPVQPLFRPEGQVLVARAIDEHNARNIGIIFSNDEAGHDLVQGARAQIADMGAGVVLTEAQVTPADAGSAAVAALTMYAENVDVVIVATLQNSFAIVVNALVAQGLNVPVFTSYISASPTEILGFAADYLGAGASFPVYTTAWLDLINPNFNPATDPPEAMFVEDYWTFVAGVHEDFAVNTFAMAGWVAASTFVQGLRATPANNITWEGLTEALETITVNLPMGGDMVFRDGLRTGTTALALLRAVVDMEAPEWAPHRPVETLTDINARIR